MSAKRVESRPVLRWALWWRSSSAEHFLWEDLQPLLFTTRQAAREYAQERYGYILTRKDLRSPPHNWQIPKPIRVEVVFREAKEGKSWAGLPAEVSMEKATTPGGHKLKRLSLKAKKRARKAAKNLVMYKTAGRRPWAPLNGDRLSRKDLDPKHLFRTNDASMKWAKKFACNAHGKRLAYLREPSGFLDMSRRADVVASMLRCIERHEKALEMLGDD